MEIIIIVAMGPNLEIGYQGKMPWYLPIDLKYFREQTTGHAILMGRRTMESINRFPLLNRFNIVISQSLYLQENPNYIVCRTIAQGIEKAKQKGYKKLFIVGGGSIYKQTLEYADYLYITKVDYNRSLADTYFPKYDISQWVLQDKVEHLADEKNEYNCTFLQLKRIKNNQYIKK